MVIQLRKQIFNKFKIHPSRQIIKMTRDGFQIRITDSFPLSFYELSENHILFVEPIQVKEKHNAKYFDKLNIMQPISEEQEYSPMNTIESFVKSTDVDAESQDESQKQELRERLMKAVNSQSLEQVAQILEECE
jgi:hypothetical protein